MTIDAAVSAIHTAYDPSDSPDDDDLEDLPMTDGFGGMEGARIDSALYDMYTNRPPSSILPSSIRPLPYMSAHTHLPRPSELPAFRLHDTNTNRTQLPHFHPSLPRLSSNRTVPSTSRPNVALQRQLSIRRAARNRMADFHEFASRRRNSQRTVQPEGERTLPSSSTLQPPRSPVDNTTPVIPTPPPGYPLSPLPRATLFEPPSPRPREYPLPSPSPPLELEDTGAPFRSVSWGTTPYDLSLVGLPPRPEPSSRPMAIPRSNSSRLRRGGLRPPESLLNTSPPGSNVPSASETTSLLRPERTFSFEEERTAVIDFEHDFGDWVSPNDLPISESPRDSIVRVEPPPSMPTPRSISPPENAEREEGTSRRAEDNS